MAIADSPSATDRNSGTTKNRPAWSEVLKEERDEPAAQRGVAQMRRSRRAVRDRARRGGSPSARTASSRPRPPPSITRSSARGRAIPARPAWAAERPTFPSAARRTRRDRARRRQHGADEVEPHALLGGRVGHAPRHHEDAEHDEDLTREHPAPRRVGREQAADQRSGGDGDRARRRDSPYARGRSARAKFDATSATIAGRISAAPRPSSNDQPKISTPRLGAIAVVNDPHAVDDAADRERTLAPDDLADLAARDHERRHHQRVQRDRGLDAGDVGADVLGDGRDRHVHHRRVERHEELPGRER